MFLGSDEKELTQRVSRVQKMMCEQGMDALLVSDNVNLCYVSGQVFSGYVYIPCSGEVLMFVRRPSGLSGSGVVYISKVEDIAQYFAENAITIPHKLALEIDSASYSECLRYQKAFGNAEVCNATQILRAVRSIKTDFEIEQFRQSARLHDEIYKMIPSLYIKGMTDLELSAQIEREFRLRGSLGIFRIFGQSMEIFMGSLIAGENAAQPSPYDFAMGGGGLHKSLPVGANGTLLTEGMSIMVDLSGNFTSYATDMSRVFSIGELPELAYKAHEVALEIEREMITLAKVGVKASDIYNMSVEIATRHELQDYFMGYSQKAGFVGHGIGLEINESPVFAPRSRDVLTENMVFAFEPKFVIPKVGAVGVENSFAVRADGVEKLTNCPETIINIA